MKKYDLHIVAVHTENQRILMSKGHHTAAEFHKAVLEYGDNPRKYGVVEHMFVKKVPAAKDSGYDYWLRFVKEGTRGSFPATYIWEF